MTTLDSGQNLILHDAVFVNTNLDTHSILAVDIGTTSAKGLLVLPDGKVIGEYQKFYNTLALVGVLLQQVLILIAGEEYLQGQLKEPNPHSEEAERVYK